MKVLDVARRRGRLGRIPYALMVLMGVAINGALEVDNATASGPHIKEAPWKSIQLDDIDKQERFGVGVEFIPEDFYYAEDVREGNRTIHKKGEPVDVIRADFGFGRDKYTIYLLDADKDGKFTPQTAPFSHNGDGMVIQYPELQQLYILPFRERVVIGGREYTLSVVDKSVVLVDNILEYEVEKTGTNGQTRTVVVPVTEEQLRGVERINFYRARAGLHNLVADLDAMKGCQGHVEDLVKKGYNGTNFTAHFGYGLKCLVDPGDSTIIESVNELNRQTYHASHFYKREILSAGAGWGISKVVKGIAVIHLTGSTEQNFERRESSYDWKTPFVSVEKDGKLYSVSVFPPNMSENNANSHNPEVQMKPISDKYGAEFGHPVFIRPKDPVLSGLKLESAVLEYGNLTRDGEFRKREDVESRWYSRHNSIPGMSDNRGIDNLLPESHLKGGWYRATFIYDTGKRAPGSSMFDRVTEKIPIQWTFKTGN